MIITTDGQLFYVSESVKDFLGYSQVKIYQIEVILVHLLERNINHY